MYRKILSTLMCFVFITVIFIGPVSASGVSENCREPTGEEHSNNITPDKDESYNDNPETTQETNNQEFNDTDTKSDDANSESLKNDAVDAINEAKKEVPNHSDNNEPATDEINYEGGNKDIVEENTGTVSDSELNGQEVLQDTDFINNEEENTNVIQNPVDNTKESGIGGVPSENNPTNEDAQKGIIDEDFLDNEIVEKSTSSEEIAIPNSELLTEQVPNIPAQFPEPLVEVDNPPPFDFIEQGMVQAILYTSTPTCLTLGLIQGIPDTLEIELRVDGNVVAIIANGTILKTMSFLVDGTCVVEIYLSGEGELQEAKLSFNETTIETNPQAVYNRYDDPEIDKPSEESESDSELITPGIDEDTQVEEFIEMQKEEPTEKNTEENREFSPPNIEEDSEESDELINEIPESASDGTSEQSICVDTESINSDQKTDDESNIIEQTK